MEVITAIATSGHDINAVRQAVIMYIVAKKKKGYSEQYIHEKLEKLELKFMHIEVLHPAWRDARALFQLRKSDHIPMPMSIVRERENEERRQLERESSSMALSSPVASSASTYASSSASMYTSSSASTYTLSSASTRPSSVPSIASVISTPSSPPPLSWDGTSKQDEPGHHSPSHAHPSRRDTALSLLSEYSDDSEPDEQVFILPSGIPQN